MTRRPTLPGEISDEDYALCRAAAAEIRRVHPFVRGKAPATMTADQVALSQSYLSLALLASGDRFGDLTEHARRVALAKEWVERARVAEAAAKEAPPATAQEAKRKRTTEPSPPVAEPELADQPLPFGP